MALTEFDQHDHPDADQLRPQVGCAVCGRAVQSDLEELEQALEEMAAWSRDHAGGHSQEDHDQAHSEFREGASWSPV